MQAQHHAKTKMDYLVFCGYNALSEQPKTSIQGSLFKDSVALGTVSTDSNGISRRMVTINVFHDDEMKPRATLEQVFYSNDANKYVTNGSSATSSISMYYDAENDKLYAKVNGETKELGSGVPIGTVIAWASNSTPTEGGIWLECNGQDCSAYSKLVAILGKSTVPDYRGVFLRGLGSVTSSHYGTVNHQSSSLGELQGDAIRNIEGWIGNCEEKASPVNKTSDGASLSDYEYPHELGAFAVEKTIGGAWGGYWGIAGTSGEQSGAMSWSDKCQGGYNYQLNTSLVVPTANENRPINRAVRYFIKAA